MQIFLLKRNNVITLFLFFTLLSIVFILFNISFPHEAFAMAPPKDWTQDWYGKWEYVGPDPYGYFNKCTSVSTQQYDDITSNNAPYHVNKDQNLRYNPVELDGKTLDKQVCKPEHKELNFWVPGQSFRGANTITYELEASKPVAFELDADYYEDTISTNLDSTHFNEAIEFVRNYKVLVNHPAIGVLSSINLGVKTSKNNIVFIYLKFQEKSRRKILWTIWEKHNSRYESYKHFKRSWDSNTSIWSKIRKDVRENIRAEVEDLLGVKKINKNLKRSVKTEVERLLREKQPFKF